LKPENIFLSHDKDNTICLVIFLFSFNLIWKLRKLPIMDFLRRIVIIVEFHALICHRMFYLCKFIIKKYYSKYYFIMVLYYHYHIINWIRANK
jgi:hypothetical protein